MNTAVSDTDDLARLRALPLFAGLGDDAPAPRPRRSSAELDVPAGQTLVQAGDRGLGAVRDRGGHRRRRGAAASVEIELGPGRVRRRARAARARRRSRSARVRAKTDVRCLAIGAGDFRQLLDDEPRIALAMLPVVAERLWRARQRLAAPLPAVPRLVSMAEKLIADNRKARHDYQLLERVEAGPRADRHRGEVPARRAGRRSARPTPTSATARRGCTAPRSRSTTRGTAPITTRPGRASCCCTAARSTGSTAQVREKGLTLVPTRLYFKDGRVKIELALARGKDVRRQAPHARRPRRQAPDRARAQGAALMGPKERERVLERLRRICLGLPEVEERLSHGAPTFFVRGKRPFVMVLTDHHGDGRFAIWCAAATACSRCSSTPIPSASSSRRTSAIAAGSASASTGRRLGRARRDRRGRLRRDRAREARRRLAAERA